MFPTKQPLKRKIKDRVPTISKKAKIYHTVDELPWKVVSRPQQAGLDGDDGILELEEIDGVDVVYEDTKGGSVARFKIACNFKESNREPLSEVHKDSDAENGAESHVSTEELDESFDSAKLLPEWQNYSLHPQLLRVLHAKKFLSPTPIQSASLPAALVGRDIVGVAQTGSGKTLAYGLPILHHLLSQPRAIPGSKRRVRALILAPTRELAFQVSSHLNACINSVEAGGELDASKTVRDESTGKSKGIQKKTKDGATQSRKPSPPRVSVAAIVGGMSTQKQRRILDRGVDILIATPGRLWDIMEEDDNLSKEIKDLRFLVLDEADRMIETGHFAELENILRLTRRENKEDQIQSEFDEDNTDGESKEKFEESLQSFIFSATLSKDLQRNIKKRFRPKNTPKYKKNGEKPTSTLDDLLLRLDFRDPDPIIIDLSPVGGVVSTLKESKIECMSADKDVYLYYFLLRYPGKSLVFLSSIDGIRRLMPLMELLNLPAFPLHSQLEQRQRLKNLDRFTQIPNSILLATDIAARGLDIPAVDHVLHYQIPRSADSYIHRNGRTARASRKGFSLLMCAPDERKFARTLLGSLGRQDSEIPDLVIELNLLDRLKYRVQIARKIDAAHHKVKKANHDRNWMKETAAAMEIELDSDYISDDDNGQKLSTQKRGTDTKIAALKAELKHLLSQPIIARGISTKYITSGNRPIADELIAGEYNETIVGLKKTEAENSLAVSKRKKPPVKTEYEEWKGISTDN